MDSGSLAKDLFLDISGQLLDRVVSPFNYQVVFAMGAIGAMLSTYHLWRLRPEQVEKVVRVGEPLWKERQQTTGQRTWLCITWCSTSGFWQVL